MNKLLFLLSFLSTWHVSAQMLDYSNGELFSEDPKFNAKFIKQNRIKSIKGYYSTKADYDRIRPTNNVYVYEFNNQGLLVKDYKIIRRDTIVRGYKYDLKHNIIELLQSDQYGMHAYHFYYDSLNRIIKKEYRRNENKTGNRIDFKIGKSYIISAQTYSYENAEVGLKKYYYNSLGKVYQTEFFYFDKNNYLYKQESRSLTGVGSAKTSYTYNSKGLLKEKVKETRLNKKNTSRLSIEYDNFDNIMAQHYYRNGAYKTEHQFVYNSSTLLLSALLSRDIETNVITILKFSNYTFFDY